MPKAFSLLSWNVEHFKGKPARVAKVVTLLNEQSPDVFALLEVEGKDVFKELSMQMPGYSFHITEGRQTQEVLVGVKKGFTSFFTQKTEFRSGNQFLRPGALLTLTIDNEDYSILFLHTKSGSSPIGMGIRDDQFSRALKFKKTLDKNTLNNTPANFLFLGDLNTMGLKYPFQKDIPVDIELKKLDRDAKKVKMRRLTKDEGATWWNGVGSKFPPSDLDHVVASSHLSFKSFSGSEITVRGWPKENTDAAKTKWINDYSDHGLVYLVVQKV